MRASAVLLMIAVVVSASTPCAQTNVDPTDPIPGRIVIRLKPNSSQLTSVHTGFTAFDSLNSAFGLKRIAASGLPNPPNTAPYQTNRLADYYTLYFDSTAPPPDSLVAYYRIVPQIEDAYVEHWYIFFSEYVPCDAAFDSQWNLRSTSSNFGDTGIDIGATKAWYAFRGAWDDNNNAVIAVIDDGVNVSHWDLATGYGTSGWGPRDNFAWNQAELSGSDQVDDDNNGFRNDILGWDFNGHYTPYDSVLSDSSVSAVTGHGTAVSTIAAAESDTLPGHASCSQLMTGVSWFSRILPIKATPTWTVGDTTYYVDFLDPQSIRAAVDYAVIMDADIINCSFGSFSGHPAEQDSVRFLAAYESGLSIFAAAGTCYDDPLPGKFPAWPAALDFVFSVGAIDGEGLRKTKDSADDWESNYVNAYEEVRLWLDAMAPGVQIVSGWKSPDVLDNGDIRFDFGGTSASAAQGSGIAALLLARYPWLENDDIYHIMRYSSRDTLGDPNEDTPAGTGITAGDF